MPTSPNPDSAQPSKPSEPGAEADPLIGQTLGETYKVRRIVGEGAMGRVYESVHIRLGKRFALKVLHPEFARLPGILQRFRREAETASAVDHENILDVVDVNRAPDGRPYIVSEFLDGESFGDLLDRVNVLDPAAAVAIARQLCRALAKAHAAGVVHRDLKPENVFLVRRDGGLRAKLLDFGISKVIGGEGNITRTGTILGTPAYMAPEQARGGTDIDHRADVYSLGAILYRALTGREPYVGDNATTILAALLTEEPPLPRALRREIPEDLERVVRKAMARNPDARYPTMAELHFALAAFDVDTGVNLPLAGHDAPAGTLPFAFIPGRPALGERAILERQRYARAALFVAAALSAAWFTLAGAGLASALVRVASGQDLTATEAILVTVFSLLVVVPPVVLGARSRVARVAASRGAAEDLALRYLRIAGTGAVAAGVVDLVLRVRSGMWLSAAQRSAEGAWGDLVVFAVALAASLVGAVLAARRVKRASRGRAAASRKGR